MARFLTVLLSIVLFAAGNVSAGDDPQRGDRDPEKAQRDASQRNHAFQDHIAYVATFVMPVLIEKCTAMDPAYLRKAAPAYFRYVNTHQNAIERGRLLTLAELAPEETLQHYRDSVIEARLGALKTGTPERKQKMCDGALGMLNGANVPGEWPPHD